MKLRPLFLISCAVSLFSYVSIAQSNKVSDDPKIKLNFLAESQQFMNGNYSASIPLYESVLKQDNLLTKDYWYVLIDNLGMAYGITGDLKSAEKLFKYGLTKDATYPMFYFELACASAENNDMKSCISYLKTANKFKKNVLPGETFPDPAKDDSFQRFMNNAEFLEALKELK